MKKHFLIVTAIATVLATSFAFAHAGKGKLFEKLNITEAQQTQIESYKESQKEEMKALKDQMKALKEQKQALIVNYSEEEAQNLASEIAEVSKSMTLARIQGHKAVYEILDDSQREGYLAHIKDRGPKHCKGKGKRGHHGPRGEDI